MNRKKMSVAEDSAKPNDPNAQIALRLKKFYQSAQEETIPRRFLELLEKLDAVERGAQRTE
ncbi:NepR family anti-sigma factor [Shinella daejeonensis]|uniref:NepR family anti-sigma factor n=1 Tax=Shinella daejeonensis TaxID=659017 RepID=UPI0020C80279